MTLSVDRLAEIKADCEMESFPDRDGQQMWDMVEELLAEVEHLREEDKELRAPKPRRSNLRGSQINYGWWHGHCEVCKIQVKFKPRPDRATVPCPNKCKVVSQ